jgi:hypothetical protein
MPQEEFEQRELRAGQADRPVASAYFPGRGIECEVGVGQYRAVDARGGTAEQSPQPGQQLLQGEGLAEIVVGPGVESGDAVGDGVARGEDEDGYVVAGRTESSARRDAVQPRHHHVEDHSIGVSGRNAAESLLAVLGEVDFVPVEDQRPAQGVTDSLVVVHDKDAHRISLPCAPEGTLSATRRGRAVVTAVVRRAASRVARVAAKRTKHRLSGES